MAAAADRAGCLVGQAVNATLESAFAEAGQVLFVRLDRISRAGAARDFAKRARRKLARGRVEP